MRAVILGLAVLGALGSGLLGMKWVSDSSKVDEAMKTVQNLGLGDDPAIKEAAAKARSLVTAGYLMVLGALVAVAAAVASVKFPEKVKVCGAVLIGCALVPALFAMKSLVFTFFLVLAGALCLTRKAPATALRPQPALAGTE